MSHDPSKADAPPPTRLRFSEDDPQVLVVERVPPPKRPTYRWRLALGLFLATCLTTVFVGGPAYAAAVMTILLCHEMGHWLQARRYNVQTSLPYFIPMPLPPLGTMGAVIAMRPRATDARGLFDIAVTGPVAGLVPAVAFSIWGLVHSQTVAAETMSSEEYIDLGAPLLFQWMERLLLDVPAGHEVVLHPVAFAGWVGFLVTALNLLPVGQLDGGHILFALVPEHAHRIATWVYTGAVVAVVVAELWHWVLLLALLFFFGIRHPPLGWIGRPLGPGRRVLGWAMLAFLVIGFTPTPFVFPSP